VTDVVLFAILGLGAGSAYALTGLGVVLVYKGSGVVNFAQAAIAMLAAFTFAAIAEAGVGTFPALAITLAGAALAGIAIHLLVMKPLRNAPALAKVIATVGLLVVMQGGAMTLWGDRTQVAPSLLPTDPVTIFDVSFGVDRIWLLGITIAVGVLLWAFYRFTAFGLATRAAAESERSAALLGYSPDVIAATNWALGCLLAAVAGVLLAQISSLTIFGMSLIILPALAAALFGRFSAFAPTIAAGVLIGVGQSELTRWVDYQGITEVLPFAVVLIAVLVVGGNIPSRGTLATGRPPFAPAGRIPIGGSALLAALVVVGLLTLGPGYQAAITTSLIVAVIALSLVIVTGYVGQTSLAQMTFAGVGGLLTSKLATDLGVPFPLTILVAALAAVPIGVALGLPALRVRGIYLAIVTLAAAMAISAAVFDNTAFTGGREGTLVPEPSIGGFSLDAVAHPERFGIMALIVMGLFAVLVSNLRRSSSGRRMLAVRNNERAAELSGVNVAATKLQAFALSAFVAGVGGSVLAYHLGSVSPARFTALQSITLLTVVYIGGIASVSGALFAGFITTGGVTYLLLNQIAGIGKYWVLLTGLLVLVTVISEPDGIAVAQQRQIRWLRRRLRWRSADESDPAVPVGPARPSD
jgi:ABC-type branched-subunit amino acid transport system permease subunit